MIKLDTMDFTVVKEPKKYVNSRGDEEEHIVTIGNLLHTELHLADSMRENPEKAEEIGKLLNDVRKTRQDLVREWSKGRSNSAFWCALKHASLTDIGVSELINNAVRDTPQNVKELAEIRGRTSKERDKLMDLFLSGEGGGECVRCIDDLCIVEDIEENEEEPVNKVPENGEVKAEKEIPFFEVIENGDVDVDAELPTLKNGETSIYPYLLGGGVILIILLSNQPR